MDKRTPHYDLAVLRDEVSRLGAAAVTRTALDNGRAMGLTTADMLQVVAQLTRQNFYKSMTAHADSRVWQDVYHADTPTGRTAYIKLTRREAAVVIQFKEK